MSDASKYTAAAIKSVRLHGISINPALNDGHNGLVRIEAKQWVLDPTGCVMDITHRLEALDICAALDALFDRAGKIVNGFHHDNERIAKG